MKKIIWVLTLSVCVLTNNSYAAIFSDDFESGTLNQWDIEGRQAGRACVAEVVTLNNSQMAHIFQDGFTEIIMSKTFAYTDTLQFAFDMKTQAYSEAPTPDSAFYATSGAVFVFMDSQHQELGHVQYSSPTSAWPSNEYSLQPNNHLIEIVSEWNHYSLDIQNILSYITIEQNALSSVKLMFGAYTSGSIYNLSADAWIDNVVVTPEPASVLLLGLGGLALRRRQRGLQQKRGGASKPDTV